MVERSISPADPIALANPSVLGQLRSVEIQARRPGALFSEAYPAILRASHSQGQMRR